MAVLASALIAGLGGGWLAAQARGNAVELVVNPLPPDERQQLVTGRCIICHSLETIAQQRQTREEWAVILDRMITYGMPMLPGDREIILEYLATRLGQ
jgi:Trp operon repressor